MKLKLIRAVTQKQFSDLVQLSSATELEKATLIAFYLLKTQGIESITVSGLCEAMQGFGLSSPNQTRLRKNMTSSRLFVKATENHVRLQIKKIEELEAKYPSVTSKSEEVIADETVLPQILFAKSRSYIFSVCNQINASYQHNIFDGCAMLMRRLLEMLIILTYRHLKREDEIKNAHGGYNKLSAIITHYTQNKVFILAKKSQDVIDEFRELGNHSAHTLEYHARRTDIDRLRMDYRVCIEELMYKSGLIK